MMEVHNPTWNSVLTHPGHGDAVPYGKTDGSSSLGMALGQMFALLLKNFIQLSWHVPFGDHTGNINVYKYTAITWQWLISCIPRHRKMPESCISYAVSISFVPHMT